MFCWYQAHNLHEKYYAVSPTVAQKSVMIIAAIVSHQRRDAATIDIPGAYLHTYTHKHVKILLKGRLTQLIATFKEKLYSKYIIVNKKGGALLYVKIQKALCGLLRSKLLLQLKLDKDLEAFGFEINPILSMCCKQDDQWSTDDYDMARV